MNALIISAKAAAQVRKAIGNSDISYEKTGRFSGSEYLEFIHSVARINIQTFITDMDCTEAQPFLEGIRQYKSLRSHTQIVVIALDRHEEDGMVHQLADMGIQVITTVPGTKPESIIQALNKLLPNNQSQPEAALELNDSEVQMERVKDRIYRFTSKLQSSYLENADVMDLEIPELPFQERVIVQDRIIGTITIAVMGVESKVGSTHFSILISNYLNRKGYSVAIVEANSSQDFSYIESAYEGIRDYTNPTTQFSINGVVYYKSTDKIDMSSLLAAGYDYLILDIGSYAESEWSAEFYRANAQILIGAGSEWRQPRIKEFRDAHKKSDQSTWFYCIPFVDPISIADIRKELPGNLVYRIPPHADPYKTQGETDSTISKLLKNYLGEKKKASTKNTLYLVIIACLLLIIILLALLFVK
ncbi:hypothetical protein [Paenibacillus bouchesdurhonensis]|uniref:hypothetical protein n=1 Tax=Paenibacillus bouchesdurhonensis TaxID=1870990 RepID=UPI000DA627AF|nr:hypothetical protein [Paenibacillus bouchesdurhonensis]